MPECDYCVCCDSSPCVSELDVPAEVGCCRSCFAEWPDDVVLCPGCGQADEA